MLDLIFDLLIDNSDVILEFIGIGAAAFIAYKVADRITEGNISQIFKNAIRKQNEALLTKIIGTTVKTIVKKNKNNIISLEVLEAECAELNGKQVQIESAAGVDPALTVGRKLSLKV